MLLIYLRITPWLHIFFPWCVFMAIFLKFTNPCCPVKNQDPRSFGANRIKNKDLIVTN